MGIIELNKPNNKALKLAWQRNPPSRFLDPKDFLKEFADSVRVNHHLSYAEISELCGFSSNLMYMVIKGIRNLTVEAADTIATSLKVNGHERNYWMTMVSFHRTKSGDKKETLFQKLVQIKMQITPLQLDKFHLKFFSSWVNAVLFELCAIDEIKADPEMICELFKFPVKTCQIRESLQLLVSLNLIRIDPDSQLITRINDSISTGSEARGLAIVGYHYQMLELARQSISSVSAEDRNLSALTVGLSSINLDIIRNDIALLKKKILELSVANDHTDCVAQINMQLFKLTETI